MDSQCRIQYDTIAREKCVTMPKVLTAERVASYRANGYLYPNDALSPAEVAHYREEPHSAGIAAWQQDFGVAETQRHEVSFKAYLESFYEQLE